MKRGRQIASPLSSIVAYLDWRRFGVFPYSGGTFEQPYDLMIELRYIADEVNAWEAKKQAGK